MHHFNLGITGLTSIKIGVSIASSACVVLGEYLYYYLSISTTDSGSPSSVQASFGFDFGAFGKAPPKGSSLPPQRSSRKTPVRNTPRAVNGSAGRHRSASVQRSGSAKRKTTPREITKTPSLGKRKRSAAKAPAGADDEDEDEDELSPDRPDDVRSIEKSRRVVGTVSPIPEDLDEAQDELSFLDEGVSSVRKAAPIAPATINGTPVAVSARKRISMGNKPVSTPLTERASNITSSSRQSLPRRPKSVDPSPATPGMLPNGRQALSSTSTRVSKRQSKHAIDQEDESEDELSPPQENGTTPRTVTTGQRSSARSQNNLMDVDELSSPVVPTPTTRTLPEAGKEAQESTVTKVVAKRGRPRRIVQDEEDELHDVHTPSHPVKAAKPLTATKEQVTKPAATPVISRPGRKRKQSIIAEEDEEEPEDELSPEKSQTQSAAKSAREVTEILEQEQSDEYEEASPKEPSPPARPFTKHKSPPRAPRAKPSSDEPPRKRHKFLGPKHSISVMRIKGSAVRGITVADTTRTILEETIDHRLRRVAEKLQTSQDPAQRKELRSELNLSLSFKESLNEKLLDLQDANDVLSTNFKKMKLFKRDNADLRKEILTLQNSRQEIAIEHDDVQMEFDHLKEKVQAKNQLSTNMFDIEAAIQKGREKARRERREDEGPELPMGMLVDTVGADVGSSSGGLLANVKYFNGVLERAAGWLEGRA